jgi:tRNA A-37 threonylcarbamoyl transferase component Bud32
VPDLLGSLRLQRPFPYDGIAEIVHLMCMGFAGRTLARQHVLDRCQMIQRAEISLQAIHNLGVLHSDPIPGNMTWNEQNRCVMFIDFERSTLQNQRRMLLVIISFNLKRRREVERRSR